MNFEEGVIQPVTDVYIDPFQSLSCQHVFWWWMASYVPRSFLLFSCSVVSSSLRPHGLQHARLPCPSPSTEACSNSCPSSWWCHPNISSSFVPFYSCLQSFPASGSFLMGQLFASGSQSIGASAPASILPMNIQDWFPLGWTGWISLLPRESQESSPNHGSKASLLRCSAFFMVQLSCFQVQVSSSSLLKWIKCIKSCWSHTN